MRTLANLARIRRVEFLIVELTIFSLPILATVTRFREIGNRITAEAFLLFFVLYALGDGVNCLADRDLDATYKTHLSRAVYDLGVGTVTVLTVLEVVVSVGLGIHLAYVTGKWMLLALVLFGIFLGIGYSVRPLQFKARGIGHLVCLWLLLYFVPMLYSALIVAPMWTLDTLLLAASYATVEMGVILINTAEDYPEDLEAGIRTTVVALGLRRGIALASWMVALGGTAFVTSFGLMFWRHGLTAPRMLVLGVLAVVCVVVGRSIWVLRRKTDEKPLTEGIQDVKACGKRVPIWATAIGWCGVLCGIVLVASR